MCIYDNYILLSISEEDMTWTVMEENSQCYLPNTSMCMIDTDTSDEHNGPKQEVSTKQDYPVSSSIT